jgi:hypothetical protein
MANDEFREDHESRRQFGKAKQHEKRLTVDPVKALRYLLAQYDRVVEVHDHVVMDTPEDRELHDRAIATFREAVEPIRKAMDTYPTAAEVKVLTEAALRLGRKEAAEDIARTADEIAEGCMSAAKVHRQASIDATTDRKKRSHMSTALMFKNQAAGAWAVRDFAQDYPYKALQDAPDVSSGVPESPKLSEESQAVSNRLPGSSA